ncbi:hypothetical protein ACIBO9_28310 [Streptomyces prunicolor]|uniref:hypothetical protein n=1 Tax=Streptomyces prunicolor TaxID=67348 RepID=UPI0037D6C70D
MDAALGRGRVVGIHLFVKRLAVPWAGDSEPAVVCGAVGAGYCAVIGVLPPTLAHWVRAAAALDCLNAAVDHWADSDGRLGLVALIDDAFAELASR